MRPPLSIRIRRWLSVLAAAMSVLFLVSVYASCSIKRTHAGLDEIGLNAGALGFHRNAWDQPLLPGSERPWAISVSWSIDRNVLLEWRPYHSSGLLGDVVTIPLWTPTLAVLVAAAIARGYTRGLRRGGAQCSRCGYDLAHLPAAGTRRICPECGSVESCRSAAGPPAGSSAGLGVRGVRRLRACCRPIFARVARFMPRRSTLWFTLAAVIGSSLFVFNVTCLPGIRLSYTTRPVGDWPIDRGIGLFSGSLAFWDHVANDTHHGWQWETWNFVTSSPSFQLRWWPSTPYENPRHLYIPLWHLASASILAAAYLQGRAWGRRRSA